MKTVLVDASSVILLHKAQLLGSVQAAYHVCMAASVFAELTRRERPGSRAVARSCRDHHISVSTPRNDTRHRLPSGLHQGERDTLLCFQDGGADFIIIDDGRGAAYCRREGIPYLNALLCPRVLSAAGRMTPEEARSAMARVSGLGRYSQWVKRYAATCSDAVLARFLP